MLRDVLVVDLASPQIVPIARASNANQLGYNLVPCFFMADGLDPNLYRWKIRFWKIRISFVLLGTLGSQTIFACGRIGIQSTTESVAWVQACTEVPDRRGASQAA